MPTFDEKLALHSQRMDRLYATERAVREAVPDLPEKAAVMAAYDAVLGQLDGARRIVFAGGPRAGKSTLAVRASERYGIPTKFADSLVGRMEWSEMSQEVSTWFDAPGDWIVEGVSTPRALRKWLDRNPGVPFPVTIVYTGRAIQVRTAMQESMAKGVQTVFEEIRGELVARGARIIDV